MGNGYWAETEVQKPGGWGGGGDGDWTGNPGTSGEWRGGRRQLRAGVGDKPEDKVVAGQKRAVGGARQVGVQIPPPRQCYSVGEGPLGGQALPLGRVPLPLSPACPPALGLQRKAHRYLNFDFILFYFPAS